MVLTYNLVRTSYQGPDSANMVADEKARFQKALSLWNGQCKARQPNPEKLVYILDHKYSEANLCLERLKGRDSLVGSYLAEMAEKEDFTLLFANMTLTVLDVVGSQERGETPEEEHYLSHVVETNGTVLLHKAKIRSDEILQEDCYDRIPDEIEDEETGNEGVDSTHFYRDAVSLWLLNYWCTKS